MHNAMSRERFMETWCSAYAQVTAFQFRHDLDALLAAEQERCANILPPQAGKAYEDIPDDKEEAYHLGYADALTDVAAAIRAGGKGKP